MAGRRHTVYWSRLWTATETVEVACSRLCRRGRDAASRDRRVKYTALYSGYSTPHRSTSSDAVSTHTHTQYTSPQHQQWCCIHTHIHTVDLTAAPAVMLYPHTHEQLICQGKWRNNWKLQWKRNGRRQETRTREEGVRMKEKVKGGKW